METIKSAAGKRKGGRVRKDRGNGWALLLIDVINAMDFPEGEKLAKAALPAAKNILQLKHRASQRRIPVIYVNDNFGRWQSDFRRQVAHCQQVGLPGAPIAELLAPGEKDYFVLKPKHSGFYSTTLYPLLVHLGVKRVILTGFAANICVLYTANDAYMRDYEIYVPANCVASESRKDTRQALEHMERFLKADVRSAESIRLWGQRNVIAPSGRQSTGRFFGDA